MAHAYIHTDPGPLMRDGVTEPGPLSTGRGGQTESDQIICHPGRHPHTQIIVSYRHTDPGPYAEGRGEQCRELGTITEPGPGRSERMH